MGQADRNPKQYAELFAAGYEAVKAVFPQSIVIVHLDNGFDNELYNWNLDILKNNGAKWDMIGMSLYPYWALNSGKETSAEKTITDCIANIKKVSEKYDCDVMIVETGMECADDNGKLAGDAVLAEGKALLSRILEECRDNTDGRCKGVFYWEPAWLPIPDCTWASTSGSQYMQEKMAAVPRMKMVVGGKEYTVSMVGKLLSYTDMKEDSSLENIDMAYIYTPDGINLYEPLTVNGITFQRLVYDDATGAIKATDADVSFPYPTALEQFCGTTSQWYLSFDIAAGTGDMDKELMDLFSNAYAINKSTQYEEFIGWYIGANSAYPGNDTNPYCMGWESNWLGLQVWDVAYGYKMSIIDEASKKISLQSTAPGINYDFYVFLDPIIEYVDAHSPYTVEFDDDQTPTTAKLVSTVDNKVWFSLTKQ